jgi:hypothetical protein
MSSIRIHTQISGANSVKGIGEVVIACKWKETAKQTSKERAVIVPMECVKASEVPESFRALVESVLLSQAESVLKAHVNSNGDAANEIPLTSFNRDELVSTFLTGADNWMTKEALEIAFTTSATWKRIVSNPNFASNAVYQMQANRFKEAILKLTGKAVQMDSDKCDMILTKIEDSDLETEFGGFVVNRLTKMKEKQDTSFDLSAL